MIARTLLLDRAHYEHVLEHCRRLWPKEACGLLAGARVPEPGEPSQREERAVTQVYPMTNVEDSAIGYSMDPKEQLAVERQLRQRQQVLLGIYHSHTASEAYPSSVDTSLAISPELSYVLVSLKDRARPIFRSYRIGEDRRVDEEQVAIVGDPPAGRIATA